MKMQRPEKIFSWPFLFYFFTVCVFILGGCILHSLAQPPMLIITGTNMAGLILMISSLYLIVVNRTLLPPELRAPRWREIILFGSMLFYGFFVVQSFLVAIFK